MARLCRSTRLTRLDIRLPCRRILGDAVNRYNLWPASGAAVRRAAWEKDHAYLLPGPHRWPEASAEGV